FTTGSESYPTADSRTVIWLRRGVSRSRRREVGRQRTPYRSNASRFNSIPRPGRVGSGRVPPTTRGSSVTSEVRIGDSDSSAGGNSVYGQAGRGAPQRA